MSLTIVTFALNFTFNTKQLRTLVDRENVCSTVFIKLYWKEVGKLCRIKLNQTYQLRLRRIFTELRLKITFSTVLGESSATVTNKQLCKFFLSQTALVKNTVILRNETFSKLLERNS